MILLRHSFSRILLYNIMYVRRSVEYSIFLYICLHVWLLSTFCDINNYVLRRRLMKIYVLKVLCVYVSIELLLGCHLFLKSKVWRKYVYLVCFKSVYRKVTWANNNLFSTYQLRRISTFYHRIFFLNLDISTNVSTDLDTVPYVRTYVPKWRF